MFYGQLLGQVLLEDYLESLFFVHCSVMPFFAKGFFTSQRNLHQLFFVLILTHHCFVHGIHMVTQFPMQNFLSVFLEGEGGVAKDACNFFSWGIWAFVAPQKFFLGCLFLKTSKFYVWFILIFFFYFDVSPKIKPHEMFFRMSPSCQIRDLGTYSLFHIYTKI